VRLGRAPGAAVPGGDAGHRVGALIVYLASDEAQNVNGRDFMIGGREVGLYTQLVVEARAFATADTWTTDEMFEVFPTSLGPRLKNEFQPPPKEEG
jgi:hypothetical protein